MAYIELSDRVIQVDLVLDHIGLCIIFEKHRIVFKQKFEKLAKGGKEYNKVLARYKKIMDVLTLPA